MIERVLVEIRLDGAPLGTGADAEGRSGPPPAPPPAAARSHEARRILSALSEIWEAAEPILPGVDAPGDAVARAYLSHRRLASSPASAGIREFALRERDLDAGAETLPRAFLGERLTGLLDSWSALPRAPVPAAEATRMSGPAEVAPPGGGAGGAPAPIRQPEGERARPPAAAPPPKPVASAPAPGAPVPMAPAPMPSSRPGFRLPSFRSRRPRPAAPAGEEAGVAEGSPRFRVWFGTNRALDGGAPPARRFGDRLDPGGRVHHGVCEVSVPRTHRFGSTGTPWWRRLLTFRWRDDRLRLEAVSLLESAGAFSAALRERMAAEAPSGRQVLFYLHGYNTSFEEAAIRAAQIGVDLKAPGATAFFSWPSAGTLDGYLADRERIEASEEAIASFLVRLASGSGAATVNVIAHSMGNRGLARAVQRIVSRAAAAEPIRFGQILLAAPDISVELFADLAAIYPRISTRTTLYASGRDRALGMSRFLQDSARAGFTPPITVVPGIDTIEVTQIDMTMLGHGYFAEAAPVLYDMLQLLRDDTPPDRRPRLTSMRTPAGATYWRFAG